jgi:hypothetical protein
MPENLPGPARTPEWRERALIAAGLFVLAAIPILLAPFPPSTDLPQHIAQVRLFQDALAHPGGLFVIQWLAPNNLIYAFLYVLWTVLPARLVAPAALMLVVLLWIAAIHRLGAWRGRSPAGAAVASLLVFNQSFYWGLLNFLVGFPVFVLWFSLATGEPRRPSWKLWGALAGTSFLLYGSHALWFSAGAIWLVVAGIIRRFPALTIFARLTALLPCGLTALLWYPSLAASRATAGFDVAPHWSPLFDRLASFMDAAFGGIRGPAETVAFVFIILWAGLSVWQSRTRLREGVDRDLLAAAVFFLAIVVVAPDKYMNTIFFGSRWLPPALIFLLLALPPPSFRRPAPKTVGLGVAAAFFLVTAFAWRRYAAEDLTGFQASLDRLPLSSRVLGLDLVKESEFIKGRPFLQLVAYAQVFKGCEPNFSFAEHYSGLVAYRTRRDVRWTPGLEWSGEKVKRTDFGFFDFVLVNGEDKDHKTLSTFAELAPVTGTGKWRLYRVRN